MPTEDDIPPSFFVADEDAPPAPRAFTPAELVACEACLRANAPTRLHCLYCGALLPVTDDAAQKDQRRPTLRALEAWEQGFNVVLLPQAASQVVGTDAVPEAAEFLRIEAEQLRAMWEAQTWLPLARVATSVEASLIEQRLGALGRRVEIVADEELAVETHAPKRIRRLEFAENYLKGWASAESAGTQVEWSQVALLVAGHISRKRIEVVERSGRAAEKELVEAREFYADEGALELYVAGSNVNWRIVSAGFDYSCLGAEKGLVAGENFARLSEMIRARATVAVFDDSYRNARHYLKFAWPLAEQTGAGNLRRLRPGRYNSEAVTNVSNEAQFTRYGRLLRHFLSHRHT